MTTTPIPFLEKLKNGLLRTVQLLAATALLAGMTVEAQAVPSYARQTGSDCAACHVGGYGPQLTPFGIRFKIGGYTDSDGKDGKVPLSAMLVANWTRTATDAPVAPTHFNANNNANMQEASLFFAGRVNDNIGTFVQATYSGFDRKSSLDQMDIRYARSHNSLGDKEAVFGISLNNNPTLTDPFNTIGQWRFPYTSSDFGFGQGNTPRVEQLGGSVIGVNAYYFWDNRIYAEIGAYNTLSRSAIDRIGTGDQGKFKGLGSYWRLAYFKDMKRDNFSLGLFGFNAELQPDRGALGTADRYRDVGVDASYQFLGNRQHIVALNASYVREWQKLAYSVGNGADNLNNSLDNYRLSASYHYNQTWGLTGSLFASNGSADAGLYGGVSYNNRPDTSGYILQADWTPWGKETSWGAPWANVRLGVQYTGYKRFNGGNHYIDDANAIDRKASDNNTLMLFLWSSI